MQEWWLFVRYYYPKMANDHANAEYAAFCYGRPFSIIAARGRGVPARNNDGSFGVQS